MEEPYSQNISKIHPLNWELEVAQRLTLLNLRLALAPPTRSEYGSTIPTLNPFCLARNCLPHLLIIWDKFTRELLGVPFQGQSDSPHSFGKCRRKSFYLATPRKWYIIWRKHLIYFQLYGQPRVFHLLSLSFHPVYFFKFVYLFIHIYTYR